jgi:hypothetical protein
MDFSVTSDKRQYNISRPGALCGPPTPLAGNCAWPPVKSQRGAKSSPPMSFVIASRAESLRTIDTLFNTSLKWFRQRSDYDFAQPTKSS